MASMGEFQVVTFDQGHANRSSLQSIQFDPSRLRPPLLRKPAGIYLFLGDFVAFCAASLVQWRPLASQIVMFGVLIVIFGVMGLYTSRLSVSLLDDLPALTTGSVAATAAGSLPHLIDSHVSFAKVALDAGALLLAVLVVRGAAYLTLRWARSSGLVRHTAVVVGAGHVGIQLTESFQVHREHGLDPVGFIDSRPRKLNGKELPVPLFGGYEKLASVVEDFAVRVVVVAFGSMREADLVEVLRTCDRLDCEIFVVPRLFEIHTINRYSDQVRGIPLVRMRRTPFRKTSWQIKRVCDIVASGLALLLLSPVMLVCAAAVRWEGGPGVLFRQQRVGLDNRPFQLLKFRSLKPTDAEESSVKWNIGADPRLGRVGRFLRRSSLDELPQLWNILSGQMSLVGPRPERPHFVNEFSRDIPRYSARHRVPSGLTGWAQVNGLRGDTSIAERAQYDNYYIENWSLWLDTKILLRTIGQVLRRSGS